MYVVLFINIWCLIEIKVISTATMNTGINIHSSQVNYVKPMLGEPIIFWMFDIWLIWNINRKNKSTNSYQPSIVLPEWVQINWKIPPDWIHHQMETPLKILDPVPPMLAKAHCFHDETVDIHRWQAKHRSRKEPLANHLSEPVSLVFTSIDASEVFVTLVKFVVK